jgi:hypothetical protein
MYDFSPVGVVEERDAAGAIGIAFDRRHLRRRALLALEIDHAVALLVAAAAAAGDAAMVAACRPSTAKAPRATPSPASFR